MEIGPLDFLTSHLERLLDKKRKEVESTVQSAGEAYRVRLRSDRGLTSDLTESIASRLQKDNDNGSIGGLPSGEGDKKVPLKVLLNAATSLLTQQVPAASTAAELLDPA